MNDLSHLTHNTISMTSREVAELTGKRHDNVLRDIDNLLNSLDSELSAGFSMVYDGPPENGYRYFTLDRDSTYCLVAGYDANARMRIIKRWQELEEDRQRSLTPGEALMQMAQNFRDQEIRVERHSLQIAALELHQQQTAAQIKAIVDGEDYLSIVAWGNINGRRLDPQTSQRFGKEATKACKHFGHHIGEVTHPLYGKVNTYPRELLNSLAAYRKY